MRTLSPNDYKLFEQIVSLKQTSLLKTMDAFLKQNYDEVISTDKYICAKGSIPIALVAHLDTVFKSPVSNIYYDTQKNVIWSPEGLGADDRAGVFAIIKLIKMGHRPHIIFTTDEEMGGIGAEQLTNDMEGPFADIKYIIELDRRGTNDCVFYDCDNPDFVDYVESFGFTEAWGSFSDISFICPVWGIAGVNLSIGYKDEHSYSETFHVSPFLATVDKVARMLKSAENSKYYKYIPALPKFGFGYPIDLSKKYKCHSCHEKFKEYELIPVKAADKSTVFYCPDCTVEKVSWCNICNEPFESTSSSKKNLCSDCEDKKKACATTLKK